VPNRAAKNAGDGGPRTSSSVTIFVADRLVEDRIDALIEFNMKHGHSDVPKMMSIDPSLGHWCTCLREANKANLVSKGKVQLLEKLGFDWHDATSGNQHAMCSGLMPVLARGVPAEARRTMMVPARRAPAPPQYFYQQPHQYHHFHQIAMNNNPTSVPAAGARMTPPPYFTPSNKNSNSNRMNDQTTRGEQHQQGRGGTTTCSSAPRSRSQPPLAVKEFPKSSVIYGANHQQGRANMRKPSQIVLPASNKVQIGQKRKFSAPVIHDRPQEVPLPPRGLASSDNPAPGALELKPLKPPANSSGNASNDTKAGSGAIASASTAPGTISCYGDHLTPIIGRRLVEFIPMNERNLVTQYTLLVIAQLRICRFTLHQKVGKRKEMFIGFPGMQCVHCEERNQRRSGAYFPTSVKTLSDSKKMLFAIAKHINKCVTCPQEVKDIIARALIIHEVQRRTELRHGSQRAFFGAVWRILHPNNDHCRHVINAMFHSTTKDQRLRNSSIVSDETEQANNEHKRSPDIMKVQQCANVVAPNSTMENSSEKSTISNALLSASIAKDQQCANMAAPASIKKLSDKARNPVQCQARIA